MSRHTPARRHDVTNVDELGVHDRTGAGTKTIDTAAGGIHLIRHVIVIMQENRSFDTYFGKASCPSELAGDPKPETSPNEALIPPR